MAVLTTRFVAVDHSTGELYLVHIGEPDAEAEATAWFDEIEAAISVPIEPAPSDDEDQPEIIHFAPVHTESLYLANIDISLAAINDGETYEVCLTNQITAATSVDALEYYKKLRRRNPAPYSAFLKFPELSVALFLAGKILEDRPSSHRRDQAN